MNKRNPIVVLARYRKAGVMQDKRKKRSKDRLRKEILASW